MKVKEKNLKDKARGSIARMGNWKSIRRHRGIRWHCVVRDTMVDKRLKLGKKNSVPARPPVTNLSA